jgi:carboxymethylenebutenolidase
MVRRIVIGGLLLILLLVLGVGGVMLADGLLLQQATDYTNVSYTADDGMTVYGYLAQPEGEGIFPAVLMVHEWWGLNAEIVEMAHILAEQGYVVLAPDTYRTRLATTVPGALLLRLTVPEDQADVDMIAAFDFLAGLPNVDRTRIGVMGFCYGGGVALRHATQNPEIAATINLYGDTILDPNGFGALLDTGRPLLGIFGAEDNQIPVSEVESFEATLAQTSIPHEVTIYPNVGHAFVNPATIAESGAAQDAWAQILAFFETNLKTSTEG